MIRFLFFLLFFTNLVFSQVNTEKLRRDSSLNGFQNQARFNVQILDGNTTLTALKTHYRLDYMGRVYSSFFMVDLQYGHKNRKSYLNRGFIHGRFLHPFKTHKIEHFLQSEYDDFIDLQQRFLLGSGFRFTLHKASKNTTFLGMGSMLEMDKIEGHKEGSFIRSTNYISSTFRKKTYLFQMTAYYQPLFSDFSDFRLLLQEKLIFKLVKNIDFVTSLQYRYDSKPNEGVRSWDLELTNGIEVIF